MSEQTAESPKVVSLAAFRTDREKHLRPFTPANLRPYFQNGANFLRNCDMRELVRKDKNARELFIENTATLFVESVPVAATARAELHQKTSGLLNIIFARLDEAAIYGGGIEALPNYKEKIIQEPLNLILSLKAK